MPAGSGMGPVRLVKRRTTAKPNSRLRSVTRLLLVVRTAPDDVYVTRLRTAAPAHNFEQIARVTCMPAG